MPIKIKLLSILLLAFFLRAYRIGEFPSLNPDEAALGYNAYSLLLTGKDEHGIAWPLHFRSFGDYKPGGYIYLAMPFVKLLGLTPLAVRLPNLILSVLSIYFLYKIVLLLTFNFQLSTLTAIVLAVSPWHLHFSRGAWESSAALSFILIGSYFFLLSQKAKTKNTLWLSLSAVFFVFSLYLYHSARIFTPLFVLALFLAHKSYFLNHKSNLIFPVLIGILLCLPVSLSFLKSGGSARFGGVGLTADSGPLSRSHELLNQHSSPDLFSRLIHNRRVTYSLSWLQKYISHFDPNFLFITGDEVPRSKSPDIGQFFLLEFPLLILGLYLFLHQSYFINHKSFFLIWLLAAPLASSLTFQAPSALRALFLVIPLTVFVSLGLYYFLSHFSFTCYLLLITCYLYSLVFYLDAYYVHAPKRYPFAWNTGFSELIPYLQSQKENFPQIFLTDKYDQPYILYLFYSVYPPAKLHPQIKLTPPDRSGFSTVRQIDNLVFGKIDWPAIPSGSLVIASDENIPILPWKNLDFPNGSPAFKIYTKP